MMGKEGAKWLESGAMMCHGAGIPMVLTWQIFMVPSGNLT